MTFSRTFDQNQNLIYLNDRNYVSNAYDGSLQVFMERFSFNKHKNIQIQNSFAKTKPELIYSVSITKGNEINSTGIWIDFINIRSMKTGLGYI